MENLNKQITLMNFLQKSSPSPFQLFYKQVISKFQGTVCSYATYFIREQKNIFSGDIVKP